MVEGHQGTWGTRILGPESRWWQRLERSRELERCRGGRMDVPAG